MDAVDQTLNDMSMSPELLKKYSDHAKSITPGFSTGEHDDKPDGEYKGSSNNNRVQFREEIDTYSNSYQHTPAKNLQDMSPEEQMMLMRKIQNNEHNERHNERHNEHNERHNERHNEQNYETDTLKSSDNYQNDNYQNDNNRNKEAISINNFMSNDNTYKLTILL